MKDMPRFKFLKISNQGSDGDDDDNPGEDVIKNLVNNITNKITPEAFHTFDNVISQIIHIIDRLEVTIYWKREKKGYVYGIIKNELEDKLSDNPLPTAPADTIQPASDGSASGGSASAPAPDPYIIIDYEI